MFGTHPDSFRHHFEVLAVSTTAQFLAKVFFGTFCSHRQGGKKPPAFELNVGCL